MPSLVHETFYQVSPETLFALHERPEALRRLSPSFPPVRSVSQDGEFDEGTAVRIELGVWPITLTWVAEIEQVDAGRRFVDVQRSGPFQSWRHIHDFKPSGSGSVMRDEVTWASKPVLSLLDDAVIRPALERYFKQRHAALAQWITDEELQTGPIGSVRRGD